MVLSGFMVNYMLRVNMNIAIVDMVPNNKHRNVSTEQVTNMSNSTSSSTIVSIYILYELNVIQQYS